MYPLICPDYIGVFWSNLREAITFLRDIEDQSFGGVPMASAPLKKMRVAWPRNTR